MMRSPHARVRNGSCNCSPDSFGCVSPLDEREQTPSAAGEGLGSSCRRPALAGDPGGESNSSSGYRLRPLPSRSSPPSSFGAVSPMDERPALTPTAAGIAPSTTPAGAPHQCAECSPDSGADGASDGHNARSNKNYIGPPKTTSPQNPFFQGQQAPVHHT